MNQKAQFCGRKKIEDGFSHESSDLRHYETQPP